MLPNDIKSRTINSVLYHFAIPTSTLIAGLAVKMRLKTPTEKKVPTKQSKELFNQPTEEKKKLKTSEEK